MSDGMTDRRSQRDDDEPCASDFFAGRKRPPEGRKDDQGKLPLELLPTDALEAVAEVLRVGRDKYGARNWEAGMAWSRLYAAALRHLWAWWRGQDGDPETGLSHLAHVCCCALFLLAYHLRRHGADDRPETERAVP